MSENAKIKENKAKKNPFDLLILLFVAFILLSFGVILYKSFDKVKTSNYLTTIKKLSQDKNPQNYKRYLSKTLEKIKNKELRVLIYTKLGNINLSLKNYPEAIDAYKNSYNLDSNNPEVCTNLGLVLGEVGKHEEAIKYLNISKKLDSKITQTHINLGVQLAYQGKISEAITSLKKAIELNPKQYRAYTNLSAIYFGIKDYDNAKKIIDLATQNGADTSPILKDILERQLTELNKLENAPIELTQ